MLFTGPVPDELGRLTMLEWIFLGVKRLEGKTSNIECKPSTFPSCQNVSAVIPKGCLNTGPPPNDVGHLDSLSSLGRLALSKNKLFGEPFPKERYGRPLSTLDRR